MGVEMADREREMTGELPGKGEPGQWRVREGSALEGEHAAGVCLFCGGWGQVSQAVRNWWMGLLELQGIWWVWQLAGIRGRAMRGWHHEVTAHWWGRAYEVTADWQTTKCEPKGHVSLEEAKT